ncbi:MAG: archease [Thermoflexales bacterium]|nr:archease [Thermoflexales bacterium]
MSKPPITSHPLTASSVQFREVEHTADLSLWARGDTLAELFANVAAGMYALGLGDDAATIQSAVERVVEVAGIDAETLLVNWLNELLYYTETEGLVFGQFEVVEIGADHLRSIARGQAGLRLQRIVKAATFHGLEIASGRDGYEVTIVFDM